MVEQLTKKALWRFYSAKNFLVGKFPVEARAALLLAKKYATQFYSTGILLVGKDEATYGTIQNSI